MGGFNAPLRLVASSVSEIPLGKGKRYMSEISPALDHIAGGWTLDDRGEPVQAPGQKRLPATCSAAVYMRNFISFRDRIRSSLSELAMVMVKT